MKVNNQRNSLLIGLTLISVYGFQNCSQVKFQEPTSKSVSSSSVDVPLCRQTSAPEVAPKLKWDWYAQLDKTNPDNFPDFSQVMATPMVADLNGDGNSKVVFVSWTINSKLVDQQNINPLTGKIIGGYSTNGVLRIVNGKDGSTIKSVADLKLAPLGAASPILVDLDGDGKIEIIYPHYLGRSVIALNSDGSLRWIYKTKYGVNNFRSFSTADLNGDGRADIILGNEVISEDASGQPQQLFTLSSGSSVFQFAHALDYTKPTEKRIIGKNGVFDNKGNKLFDLDPGLLYAAAEVDPSSPGIEIVGSGGGKIKIYDGIHGQLLKSVDLSPISELQCPKGVGGGAPTIGDFDGNPHTIEIAVATGKYLTIFDQNLNLIAKLETQDCSSEATGISSFDFNGDGKPEILYGDEKYFRILELKRGQLQVVSKIVNPSGTLLEYPVVVDLEGNGTSAIVVASNNYYLSYSGPSELQDLETARHVTGVRAFESTVAGSWMPTGKIWNQYDFNPMLITEHGLPTSTPIVEGSYLTKIFRRNVQLALFEPKCSTQ